MKKILIILLIFLAYGCKSYYLSPYVMGKVIYENKGLSNVSIKFLNETPVFSDEDGKFNIEPKKEIHISSPDLRDMRMFNSPLIVFEKKGFLNDTIDIRDYNHNTSVKVLDTVDIGNIYLSPKSD